MNGKANVVPSTPDAIAFRRTPQEVLHIVSIWLSNKAAAKTDSIQTEWTAGSSRP